MTTEPFSLTSDTIEAGLLASCTDITKWLELASLREQDFAAHRSVYNFMGDYLAKYGSLPGATLIRAQTPDWNPTPGDFAYWLDLMKTRAMAAKVHGVLVEGHGKYAEKPEEELDYLLSQLSLLRAEQQSNHIQASDFDIKRRFDKYIERTKYVHNSDQIMGLRTGLKILDKTQVGWQPKSLVGAYARTNVGKSWFLLWQSIIAWMDGRTVLTISPEMSTIGTDLRLDVLWCAQLGYPIRYDYLQLGNPEVRENYRLVAEMVGQSQRYWTYENLNGKTIGLKELDGLIRQHKPDLVAIDGVALLDAGSRRQSTWEQMKDVTGGLKNLATQHDTVVMAVHQASNRGRGRTDSVNTPAGRGDDFALPSLNDAAFSDAFVQFCSDVITMVRDPKEKNLIWYSIRKMRERAFEDDTPARMALAVDFRQGIIHDMSEHGIDIVNIGIEMRKLGIL